MAAEFKVINIDPEGSGMDWSNHLGTIFNGRRCCKNYTIVFGTDGNFGPFVIGELEPLNYEAIEVMWDILIHREERRIKAKRGPAQIIYSRTFQRALAELTGQVYFDVPEYGIKKGDG